MLGALGAGGHLRVGLEDTLTFSRGRPVARNAELVERAAALARLAQRPPMSPAEARTFLSITKSPTASHGGCLLTFCSCKHWDGTLTLCVT